MLKFPIQHFVIYVFKKCLHKTIAHWSFDIILYPKEILQKNWEK